MNVHELTLQNYAAVGGCPSACQPMLYLGTAGSYGNEQINVVLGEGWQGLTVKAVFQPSGVPVVVPNGGGVISVPWEATDKPLNAMQGRIVFEGVTDGRVLISTDIPYAVGSHSDTEGSNSQPPTPSQWEQFVDEVKSDADRAEQAAKDAEATLQDVKDAGAQVKSDADRAAQAAADAEAAVQKVTNAGTQAVTDIGNAKDSALEAIDKAREEAAGSISADVEGAKQAAAQAEQSAKDAADVLANVQAAGKSALDDIATERQNTLSDIQNEGAKQQSAVAGAGTAALEAIGRTEQAAINQVQQTGATQVGAVRSAGTTQVGLVNSAGQQQAGNIAYAGSQQVQAVQVAGTAAVGTVNDARDEAVEEIETANAHSPQINQDTGYWQTWDAETGEYVDTTIKAEGPQGNKGDTGNPGPQGETGATPQLTVGAVTTLEPGEDATVTITGTAEAPVLNFGIPKGEQGDGSTSGSDLPTTTAADSGKVPTVNAAGTGYELAGPYAPLSAAIRPTASGNPVNITDSVEWPLLGLKVYGKSTQDGTPSPENPVPIVSAGDGGSIDLTVSNSADQNQQLIISTHTGLPGVRVSKNGNYIDPSGQQFLANYRDWERGVDVQMCCDVVLDGTSGAGFDNGDTWHISPSAQKDLFGGALIFNQDFQEAFSDRFEIQSVAYDTSITKTFYVSTEGSSCSMSSLLFETPSIDGFKAYFKANPTRFVVPYAEPIETPIPPEELTAYRALHTYDGTTVVSTAEDVAGIEVRYLADGEKYVERIVSQKAPEAAVAHTMALLADGIREGVNGV